jgi:hypothetical protein
MGAPCQAPSTRSAASSNLGTTGAGTQIRRLGVAGAVCLLLAVGVAACGSDTTVPELEMEPTAPVSTLQLSTPAPTDTEMPATDTVVAATATAESPTAEPTSTLVPPTPPPPPTTVPPTASPPLDLDPYSDRNYDEFSGYEQMQAWRNYWIGRGISNPGRLDGDGDAVACEEGEGGRAAAAPPQPPAPAALAKTCCKHCTPGKSKACGDSCISINKTCHKGPGCACDG